MKKTLLLITFVFGLGSSAWASTCVSGTLAIYDATGFTCSLGDITFSNFMYTDAAFGGAVAPPDSGVSVTPVTSGFGTDTGLLFTSGWLVGAGQTIDSSITYDVSTTNTGGITDLRLVTVGGAANGGLASVAEISLAPPETLFTQFGSRTRDSERFSYLSSGDVFEPDQGHRCYRRHIRRSPSERCLQLVLRGHIHDDS